MSNHIREETLYLQASEFIFPNEEKIHDHVYKRGNFKVVDNELRQIHFNMSVELSTCNKQRYFMYLDLFRYLYDFLSMNLMIRKGYFETYLGKTRQFQNFFRVIKENKTKLHSD